MNPTEVREVIQVTSQQQVREALAFAAAHQLKVLIAGKVHSQGGYTSIKGGIVLDMTAFNHILDLDQNTKAITVESGVTWGADPGLAQPVWAGGGSAAVVEHLHGRRFAGRKCPWYGSIYYFPYQRYATRAQIREAYPLPDAFIQKKVVHAPKGVFDNTASSISERGN